jgi:cellulose synthase/poly-beta-1,6-N-acetylglucosamine synthase-like glycosyltransferase
MDGDSALSSQTLRYGSRHFRDPKVGAVAGNVKVLNATKMITNLQSLEYVEGLNMVRTSQSYLKMVNIIPGPIGIFRKQAIIDAGWYSSDTYAEDADLTLKVRQAGWHIVYEPKAIAYTEAPESMYQLLKQRYRWTRGLLQSLKKHRQRLFKPRKNFLDSIVLWSMFYEAILWPSMNIFANLFLILVAIFYGMSNLIPLWYLSITLLDIMAALYCVAAEKEDLKLIPYAFIYRLFFVLTIDITKVAATIEEFLGFDMTWGKLERIGLSGK